MNGTSLVTMVIKAVYGLWSLPVMPVARDVKALQNDLSHIREDLAEVRKTLDQLLLRGT